MLRQVLKNAIQLSAIKPGGTAAKKRADYSRYRLKRSFLSVKRPLFSAFG